jgi:hypothetical protein
MNVYWTVDHQHIPGALNVETPELVLKNKPVSETSYNICPAFRDYFHNVYGWKAIDSFSLEKSVNGNEYISNRRNLINMDKRSPEWMAKYVDVRSVNEQVISLYQQDVSFVTDSPSLKMSLENPSFEDNEFTSSCYVIPGTIDIGNYFRLFELAFRIKKNHSVAAFDAGDIICYFKFHTPEKINFKRYFMSEKLREYNFMIQDIKSTFTPSPRPLSFFYAKYKKFNLKRKIMKEIKKNLI